MTIEEFIQTESQKPFVWGQTDCCSTLSRWIEMNQGSSIKNSQNLHFSNEKQANALIARDGNLIKFLFRVFNKHKAKRTKAPKAGDFGILFYDGKAHAAIKCEGFWFSRDETGIKGICDKNAQIIRAWKI